LFKRKVEKNSFSFLSKSKHNFDNLCLGEFLRLFNRCAQIILRIQRFINFFLIEFAAYKLIFEENLLEILFSAAL